MKIFMRIYFLALFSVLSVVGGCQEKPEDHPEKDDSKDIASHVEVKKIDEGEVRVIYYDGGATRTETQYVNGIRNGFHRTYDEEGRLSSEATFVNDKMEGPFRAWYPNGKLKILAQYKAGKLHGESLSYNEEGQLIFRYTYENNKLKQTIKYDSNGNVEYIDNFE
ncbi:MAG: hypothetical protein Kow0098_12410 [Ignavibacteriaceae bacterium]